MPPLTIWCDADLPPIATSLLADGLSGHRLIRPQGIGDAFAAALADADVAFGQPDADQIRRLPRLVWIHVSSAGYTAYDRDDVREALRARGAALTKSSLVYAEPCAQHVLAFLLAHARQLPTGFANSQAGRAWPHVELRARSRLLGGQTAVLVGFGTIGRRLVELLAPLRMRMVGVARAVAGDEPVPTFVLDSADAARALADADHVINLLPASPETRAVFDVRRLSTLKPGAVFYNIGRGTTVDQTALMAALTAGSLAAAYLDVTDPEPLPPDHPLWTAPHCFITPHTAGGHDDEPIRLVQHFLDNFSRFTSGRPLLDRVT